MNRPLRDHAVCFTNSPLTVPQSKCTESSWDFVSRLRPAVVNFLVSHADQVVWDLVCCDDDLHVGFNCTELEREIYFSNISEGKEFISASQEDQTTTL